MTIRSSLYAFRAQTSAAHSRASSEPQRKLGTSPAQERDSSIGRVRPAPTRSETLEAQVTGASSRTARARSHAEGGVLMRQSLRIATFLIALMMAARTLFAQGGTSDCYRATVGEVVCGSGGSGGSPLCKGVPDDGYCGGSPGLPGGLCCSRCHGNVCNDTTPGVMWPLSLCAITWPLDNSTPGIFFCHTEGYLGPEPRDLFSPTGPPSLSFADEGAVVYMNPIDPKADSTRNNTYVDPASGAFRFRLPLNLEFKGRSASLSLEMIFNSGRSRPEGAFGDFWAGSWEDCIIADAIEERGPNGCADPIPDVPLYQMMNSHARLMEHHGGSTTVWTNIAAIEHKFNFASSNHFYIPGSINRIDGLPTGNLLGAGEILPPNGNTRDHYEVVPNDESVGFPANAKIRPAQLGPSLLGNIYPAPQDDAGDFLPFEPPLGDDRRMHHRCGGTEIRSPDGQIDRFGPLHVVGEHYIDPNLVPTMHNPLRSQFMAHRIETVYPNGDRITYGYDGNGRTGGIIDEFGRPLINFIYDGAHHRLIGITDLTGRVISFEYNSDDLLSSITLARTGQTWHFEYTSHLLDPPGYEVREIIKAKKLRIIDTFKIYAPQDAAHPAVYAAFSPLTVFQKTQPCVTELILGGAARSFDQNGDGVPDYSFQSSLTVDYTYTFHPTDELADYTTKAVDSLGHETLHVFDWQSREKSRTEKVTYNGSTTPLITTYSYTGLHPKVVETVYPRGNKVTDSYQFQFDDIVPAVSYYDDGPRDRFGQQHLLQRTKTGLSSETISESWTYEPVFQQVWTHTDPRGNTTTSTYDYQESGFDTGFLSGWNINQTALQGHTNLGDVNGDGVTNQLNGCLIKVRAPPLSITPLMTQHNLSREAVTLYSYNAKGQILRETDPAGYTKDYLYYSGPGPHQGSLSAAPGGYLGRVSADSGGANAVTEIGYDELGRRTWAKSPRGFPVVRTYSESNRVVEEIAGNINTGGTPNGADYTRTQFDFDLNDNVIEKRVFINTSITPELTYAGLHSGWITTRYGYDILDQVRAAATEAYDPLAAGSPNWNTNWFHYDGKGRTTKEVSSAGRAISYQYDSFGRIKSKRRYSSLDTAPSSPTPPSASSDDPFVQFEQDANGNLITATVSGPGANHVNSLFYDGFDRRVQLIDSIGTITTQTLDVAGNICRVQIDGKRMSSDTGMGTLRDIQYYWDERGQLSQTVARYFVWEHHNGPLQLEDCQGGSQLGYVFTDFAYDPRGLKLYETDDLGHEFQSEYDGLGRVIRAYAPQVTGFTNRNYFETTYDNNNNVTQTNSHAFGVVGGIESQDSLVVTFSYDGLDRTIEERRQPGASNQMVTTSVWSSLGDCVRTINPNGIGTRKQFDTLHRESITEFGWNSTFTAGQITDATYNVDGLIRSERQFDADGKLLAQRDDSAQPTTWAYDSIGRLITTTQADQSKEKLAYNRDGTVATETRTFLQGGVDTTFSSATHQYDIAMRKTRTDFNLCQSVSGLSGVYLETFDYDGLGRVASAATEAYVPNSTDIYKTAIDSEYDTFDRCWCDDQLFTIDHASIPDVSVFTCVESEYDGVGNRIATDTTNYHRSYSFDELNRVNGIFDGSNALLHSFTWIGAGYRLNEQSNLNGTKTTVGLSGYDNLRRLTQVSHTLPGGSSFAQFNYSYDVIGNEIKEVRGHLPNTSQRLTYDAGNRMTKFERGNDSTGSWTEKHLFNLDGVGNWRSHKVNGITYTNPVDSVNQYSTPSGFDATATTYDKRGNLLAYGSDSYVYDVRGRLVSATVGGGAQQNYAYDARGRRLAAEGWASYYEAEREIGQFRISNPSVTRTYTYGVGLDDVLSYETNNTRYFIHKNRNGSTVALTTSSGALAERYDYTPYGAVTATDVDGGGFIRVPYLFGGRRWDQATGLYFMRTRYYEPDMGRFTSRDTIGFWGDPNNWGNSFAYCGDNPLGHTDPYGTNILDVIALACDVTNYYIHVQQRDYGAAVVDALFIAVDTIFLVNPILPGPRTVALLATNAGHVVKAVEAARDGAGLVRAANAGRAAATTANEVIDESHKPTKSTPGEAVPASKAATTPGPSTPAGDKSVPNPNGRRGGPAHQEKVAEVIRDIEGRGLKAETEFHVNSPGGYKADRFADVAAVDPKTGEVLELHQVGKQNKNGSPVKREREAMADIESATGIKPKFHPYNE